MFAAHRQVPAILSLAETLREVAGQVPEVAHQIALASRRCLAPSGQPDA
jgi:hypothetical protein